VISQLNTPHRAPGITHDPMYLVLGVSPGRQSLVAPAVQRADHVRVRKRGA